jgi:hypothetical protein
MTSFRVFARAEWLHWWSIGFADRGAAGRNAPRLEGYGVSNATREQNLPARES